MANAGTWACSLLLVGCIWTHPPPCVSQTFRKPAAGGENTHNRRKLSNASKISHVLFTLDVKNVYWTRCLPFYIEPHMSSRFRDNYCYSVLISILPCNLISRLDAPTNTSNKPWTSFHECCASSQIEKSRRLNANDTTCMCPGARWTFWKARSCLGGSPACFG